LKTQDDRSVALRVAFWFLAAVLAALALYSRRPDALRYPQFFAEDGHVWYQQAYNWGWLHALLHPDGAYFQTLPRLVASVSLLFPLARAPLIFNLCGLAVEAAPALFLLSRRLQSLGSLTVRCVLAFLYLAIPNMAETHATIEYGQWHLAVLAFLVLIAEPPQSRAGVVFDIAVLALCAVTGPFCIFLLLPAVVLCVAKRQSWNYLRFLVLSAGAVVQGLSLLLNLHQDRSHAPLGASLTGFCRIVAGQIVLPIFQGRNRLEHWGHTSHQVSIVAVVVTVLAITAAAYALLRGPLPLRCFLLFAGTVFAAALVFPMGSLSGSQWQALSAPESGARYWLIPEAAAIAVLVWMIGPDRQIWLRATAGVLAITMLLAIVKHWQYWPMPNLHFPTYAMKFEQLSPGATMTIPLNPPGWSMTLIKHGSN
jgi:hypothetical protein